MKAGQVRLQEHELVTAPRKDALAAFQINLTVRVADLQALWTAAATRLLSAPDMTLDDVLDVIGPREDPSIADCIATLAQPTPISGCTMDDFWIDRLHDDRPPLDNGVGSAFQLTTNATARRAPRIRRTSPRLALCGSPALHGGPLI